MSNEQTNDKTERATPRRREKERDRGNIAKSQDFTSSLMLTLSVTLIFAMGNNMLSSMESMLTRAFNALNPNNIPDDDIVSVMSPYFQDFISIVALFFILLVIGAIVILRFQTGSLFAKEALKPNFQKLSPSSAIKALLNKINIFKPRQMVELIKSLIKTMIVAYVGFSVIMKRRDDLFSLIGADTSTGFSVVGSVILQLMISICIILLIIGILDRQYQTYEYEKSIKMTKQEVKDEMKDIEGDPKIKGKIRAFQMKIMQQKMMAKVPMADVVVVNPTHYAVALMYDPSKVPAPVVVAKGVDFVAFKIREIAKNNGIPIVENKPLARSLYKLVEVDNVIPAELYVAVAEILQYVYTQKNK